MNSGSAWEARLATQEILNKYKNYQFKFIGKGASVSGPETQLIWQHLRFNPAYRAEVDNFEIRRDEYTERLRKRGVDGEECGEEIWRLEQSFADKWALTRYVHYKRHLLPTSVFFKLGLIRRIQSTKHISQEGWLQMIWDLEEMKKGAGSIVEPLLFMVNSAGSPATACKLGGEMIKSELTELQKKMEMPVLTKAIKGSSQIRLFENVVCFYFREQRKYSFGQLRKLMKDLFGAASYQDQQLKRRIKQFKSISSSSPWCFLRDFSR